MGGSNRHFTAHDNGAYLKLRKGAYDLTWQIDRPSSPPSLHQDNQSSTNESLLRTAHFTEERVAIAISPVKNPQKKFREIDSVPRKFEAFSPPLHTRCRVRAMRGGGSVYWGSKGGESRGIVVVFGWVSLQESQLRSFVELYSSLGWNSLICHAGFLSA